MSLTPRGFLKAPVDRRLSRTVTVCLHCPGAAENNPQHAAFLYIFRKINRIISRNKDLSCVF